MDTLTRQEAFRLIGAIKGVPLVCLILLKINGLPMGVKRVAAISGYSYNTVSKGFLTLAEYGLTIQTRRFEGWQLTDKGRQLILMEGEEGHRFTNMRNESQNLRLGSSSGSGLLRDSINHEESLKEQLPLLLQNESQNLRLDLPIPDLDRMTTLLTHRCGCPPKNAAKAVSTALAAGLDPLLIELRALWWLAYCLSPEGRGLKTKGVYIAERIEQNIPCPDYFDLQDIPDRYGELKQEIEDLQEKYQSLIKDL